jgi:tRNA modification GTPase
VNPHQDTIAAVATAPGNGAISVLRLSGPEAFAIAGRVFRGPEGSPRTQILGNLLDRDGSVLDHVLLTRFPGPRSYTGEDVVEISCHGGRVVTRAALRRLLEAGARPAQAGEFTQRAFLNGKMDLTQAEAVMDLISARTDHALRSARRQLDGALGERIGSLRRDLIHVIAHVEAHLDFPEEDIAPDTANALRVRISALSQAIDALRATADRGRWLRDGVATVLCGAPNVGKSSLLNRLLGVERAIVSESAGTTRDTIEEAIDLDGIPLRITDTAGLRESTDPVEREGMARTERCLREADLILELFDGHEPPPPPSGRVLFPDHAVHVRVLNKADLGLHPGWETAFADDTPDTVTVAVSCRTGAGLDTLRATMAARLPGLSGGDDLVSVNARHARALDQAGVALGEAALRLEQESPLELAAADLRDALGHLDLILGKTDVEEILDVVFGTFCIGK